MNSDYGRGFGFLTPVLFIGWLLFVAWFGIFETSSQDAPIEVSQTIPTRYLLKADFGHGLFWRWYDQIPYIETEEMCWDELFGWACDMRVRPQDGGNYHEERAGQHRYDLFIVPTGANASIYENEYGCWIYWWPDDYGEDGNPHPISASWINCIPIEDILP